MRDAFMLVLLLASSACWTALGWQLCTSRHRQRGMEVDPFFDRPSDLWPDGSPVVVPDDARELTDATAARF